MAVIKCKICGGTVSFEEGKTVGVCENCGTTQTIPSTRDEAVSNIFNRANNLRRKAEFDQAAALYEKIIEQDDSEAEAHWGLVLCKFGVEYVQDPATGEQIPTCHRTAYESVTSDVDYLAARDYSDMYQQAIYEAEARKIDEIQRNILAIANAEDPFDVFLCYKETDESGNRTEDSVTANEIYYQLTQEGLKVFYAPITLEDKIGEEYEPYIFSALNSAKVMLVIGSKEEYFAAPWVKNEWSRFLKIIRKDHTRIMIPCYKNMDAYRLPPDFAHLQALDMSKLGFMMDILRAVKKYTATPEPAQRTAPNPEPAPRMENSRSSNAPLSYEEKQREIACIREDYANLPEVVQNKALMDQLHALEQKKRSAGGNSAPDTLAKGIVLCCIGIFFWPLLIPGVINLIRGIKNRAGNSSKGRSAAVQQEIQAVQNRLNQAHVIPFSDYLASEMKKRGIQWTAQELEVKALIEAKIGQIVTVGSFGGKELPWIVVSKFSNKMTLLCAQALGKGPADSYGQYMPEIPNYATQGLVFEAPRLFTVSEYMNLAPQNRQAMLLGTNTPVWWRLSNVQGEMVFGKKLVPDVAPNGALNQKGHLSTDGRIYYRPALSITYKA